MSEINANNKKKEKYCKNLQIILLHSLSSESISQTHKHVSNFGLKILLILCEHITFIFEVCSIINMSKNCFKRF